MLVMKALAKSYNPGQTEEKIYKFWEENELFKADANSPKEHFSIVIPPPNVTGVLHMGHALDGTLQDILIRYKRMKGFEVLWLPGTDHAGIATQNVIEKELRKKGKTRQELGREKFLKITWDWANKHRSRILEQFKRLGASFDLSRERFTLDEGCSKAVKEVLVRLYKEGLIYKGAYIVNWCPRCRSAISDIETDYLTEHGGRPLGDLNPLLYEVAQGAKLPAFRAVTQGANAIDRATPGYDLVTGLGTPRLANLAEDLLSIKRSWIGVN